MFIMTDYQQTFKNRPTYLTAGKFYEVVNANVYGDLFTILDDEEYPISVPVDRVSAHLNDVGVFKLYEKANSEPSDKELIKQLLEALEACVEYGSYDWVLEKSETAIAAAKKSLKSA